ncbi:hypothetical protein DXG03_004411, partial [Asterophora parasitica]
ISRNMALEPPSARLPPIRTISSQPVEELSDAIAFLRHIYNPEVRGSRRSRPNQTNRLPSGKSPSLNGLDDLRADAFERSYAIRWLTALVAQAELWDSESDAIGSSQSISREALLQASASLLATCSGAAAAGVIVRDFVFEHGSNREYLLKVHVKDVPIDNRDYASVGAQTWGGACVLAETILDDPPEFALLGGNRAQGLRILELGAGTGLVSLVVGKLLESATPQQQATIIATDYYPAVLDNLGSNIQANFPPPGKANHIRIVSHFLDWSLFPNERVQNPPFDAPFDLILGADVVYEAQHAIWIRSCVASLLRKPYRDTDPLFHLMVPVRYTHSFESSTLEAVFSNLPSADIDLRIVSKEVILCDAGNGLGSNQVEYAYYKIGWRQPCE